MAILTAAELRQSREAVEHGLNSVSDADANQAIARAEARLNLKLGYPVADDATTVTVRGAGEDYLVLPRRARSITAVTQDGTTVATTSYYLSSPFVLRRGSSGYRFDIESSYGYWYPESEIVVTGTFGFDPGYVPEDEDDPEPARDPEERYLLAQEAVEILAVRLLLNSDSSDNIPEGTTSITAEGVSFDIARADGTDLIAEIGVHPLKEPSSIGSVRLSP
jgi:hypothetical protein